MRAQKGGARDGHGVAGVGLGGGQGGRSAGKGGVEWVLCRRFGAGRTGIGRARGKNTTPPPGPPPRGGRGGGEGRGEEGRGEGRSGGGRESVAILGNNSKKW